jgi:hypothetical protein
MPGNVGQSSKQLNCPTEPFQSSQVHALPLQAAICGAHFCAKHSTQPGRSLLMAAQPAPPADSVPASPAAPVELLPATEASEPPSASPPPSAALVPPGELLPALPPAGGSTRTASGVQLAKARHTSKEPETKRTTLGRNMLQTLCLEADTDRRRLSSSAQAYSRTTTLSDGATLALSIVTKHGATRQGGAPLSEKRTRLLASCALESHMMCRLQISMER